MSFHVLQLSPDELLTTTRSVRKRLDLQRPVPSELLRECLEIAVQAPTGGSLQQWQFVVVTEAEKKRAVGEIYKKAWYAGNARRRRDYPAEDVRGQRLSQLVDSAMYLADHMGEVPAMVFACIEGRLHEADGAHRLASQFASILPAVWSFQLAARARHLGTVLTTGFLEDEAGVASVLGIPYDRITIAAMVPVAYYTGESFRSGPRVPLDSVVHWEGW
ncbi:MAG TPA: nitroreductase family protein [Chloroflexota bacterium]|nr:nitroreductase family protein [Chloroflexota bacterium]